MRRARSAPCSIDRAATCSAPSSSAPRPACMAVRHALGPGRDAGAGRIELRRDLVERPPDHPIP
ncbi:MAG: hypothetical protein MZW92_37810 [Comamonadaceae bacterium]|nr:hypothetical protein [Comamonadaceae bacterium]